MRKMTEKHTVSNLHFFCKNSTLEKSCIVVNLTFWTQFWQKILKLKFQKIEEFRIFAPKYKIDFFQCFREFNFGSKSRILIRKFDFLILFWIRYSRISFNFGAKIQIFRKDKVWSKLNFSTQNLSRGVLPETLRRGPYAVVKRA